MIAPQVSLADPPLPLAPDEQVANCLLRIAGDGFRVHETEHFTIRCDASSEVLRRLTGRLEATYDAVWRFCEQRRLNVHPPLSRLQVVLFDRQEDFRRYCRSVGVEGAAAAGLYSPETNLAVFSNMSTQPEVQRITKDIDRLDALLAEAGGPARDSRTNRDRPETLPAQLASLRKQRDAIVETFNRLILQHEVAHQVLFNIGVHVRGADNPPWLVEGLACLFEIPHTDSNAGLPRINHMRLADLRDALGAEPGAESVSKARYRAAFDSKRLLELADMIARKEPFTQGDTRLAYRYAQAWGLVYYLSQRHQEGLTVYLQRLSARTPGRIVGPEEETDDFESAIAPIDDDFAREWMSYILGLPAC